MEKPKTPNVAAPNFVVAGHEVLFDTKTPVVPSDDRERATEEQCDACGEAFEPAAGEDSGYAIAGRGRYLWTRGEERRAENPPLCPSCAAAIGMMALQQWNIEEDEG